MLSDKLQKTHHYIIIGGQMRKRKLTKPSKAIAARIEFLDI